MKIIENLKNYLTTEKVFFKEHKKTIDYENKRIISKTLIVIAIFAFLSAVVSIFDSGAFSKVTISYYCLLFSILTLYFLTIKLKDVKIKLLFYSGITILYCYAIILSNFFFPNEICVFILAVVFYSPAIFIDKTYRLLLFNLAYIVIYLIFVLFFKEASLKFDEIINVVIFAIVGSILGVIFCKQRLLNILLNKKSGERELTDTLTGLNNRRKLVKDINEFICGEFGMKIKGIAIVDVDYFKRYNSDYGHIMGDRCLKKIGHFLKIYGKENDMSFYRYGGEEFVAISYADNKQDVINSFDRIRNGIVSLKITNESNIMGVVTASVGVVMLNLLPSDVKTKGEELNSTSQIVKVSDDNFPQEFRDYLAVADSALYEAKRSGRNAIIFKDM